MRRHPALQPLSRDHHQALLLVRSLRRSLPGRGEPLAQAQARLGRVFERELEPHFEIEERLLPLELLPLELCAQFRAEHRALRAAAALSLAAQAADQALQLVQFANLLERHVRFEEQQLYPAFEALLGAETLATLGVRLCASEPERACSAPRRDKLQVDTFLFDLDGTLIDSIALIRASFEHALRVHGHEFPSDAVWLDGFGRPLSWQFARYTQDQQRIAAMIATYRVHNLEHHDQMVQRYPGALEAVRELAGRGRRLAIVTSKQQHSARRGLALCGFEDLFEFVIGSDDVTRHKPDPAPVLLALERLGVAPQRAVMVGDSPHDLASGRAAGTRTAAAGWGPFAHSALTALRPDAWLNAPCEIAGLPQRLRPSSAASNGPA